MRYRKLDKNYDYSFGRGPKDFYVNVPDAPAQAVLTRLEMNQGEWFLDRNAGTPWKTQVLGFYTGNTRDPVIRSRIIGTQGVTQITQYSSDIDRDLRKFAVQVEIQTEYGDATMAAILAGEPQ